MNSLRKGVAFDGKYTAILIIIVWAFFAALIQVKPTPRLILPFLALNGILLILFPFKTYFPIFAVLSFALPSFKLVVVLGGWNVKIIEMFLVFLIAIIVIELIWKKCKFKITPISFFIAVFLLLTLIQAFRGISLGYKLPLVRSAGRNLAIWSVFLPMVFYLQNTDEAEKFLRYALLGWGLGASYYMLSYLGVFSPTGIYVPDRPFWPSNLNITIFFPFLILLLIPFEKGVNRSNFLYYGGLILITLLILIPTQTRTIYVILIIQLVTLSSLMILVQDKGQRLSYFLKILFVFGIIGLLSLIMLRLTMGENFTILVQTLIRRFDTIYDLRTDLSLSARRWQIYETMTRIKGHWFFGRGIGFEWGSFKGIFRIDNIYFSLLMHYGLVGLGVFCLIIVLWIHHSVWLIIHRNTLDKYILKAFVLSQPAVILGIIATGFASAGFVYTSSNIAAMVYWIMFTEYLYVKHRKKNLSVNKAIPIEA